MITRQLGRSDLHISPLGLGTWAIGGDGSFGWGPQADADSLAALRRGVESGINWIDTAPIYGFGHAEKIVARVLAEMGSAQLPMVFTKCSLVWDDQNNVTHTLKAGSIRREVEASLKRLGVDRLDLCQVHWPAFPPGGPDPDLEEAWTTLAELKDKGRIRHIGVSNFDVPQMQRMQAIVPITSLQPPYSLLMRQVEDRILPFCRENGIGVIVYSPMHNGLLTGKMTRERIAALPSTDWRVNMNPAFKEPHLTRNLQVVDKLREIGAQHDRSAGEVAVAWTLRQPAVSGAIVGVRRAEQVDGMVGAVELRLSEDEVQEIQALLPASLDMMQLA